MRDYVGQRLERATKTPLRSLGRLSHAPYLPFASREQGHQQVRLVERIGAQNQSFRLLGHGKSSIHRRKSKTRSSSVWAARQELGLPSTAEVLSVLLGDRRIF